MSVTFAIYLLWLALIFGTVSLDGEMGLATASLRGEPVTWYLMCSLQHPLLAALVGGFAFFAIVTSFLGIALGLFDFLADGLAWPRAGWGKAKLIALIVVPSIFFALGDQRAFIEALDTSGGIGDSLLNGLLPALMVITGRRLGCKGPFRSGGRATLSFVIVFALLVLSIELKRLFAF
jgi:tyrosine-specific transport protein